MFSLKIIDFSLTLKTPDYIPPILFNFHICFFISILVDRIIYDIARRNPIEVMGDIYFTIIAKTKIILTLLPRNITKYFYCHWILFSAFLLFFRSVIIFILFPTYKCFQSFLLLFKDKCSVRRKWYVSHSTLIDSEYVKRTMAFNVVFGKVSVQ